MIYSFKPLHFMKGCRWMTYHLTVHTVIMPMYKKTNERETETDRDRHRQADRQTETERGRQTDRQADRHTYREPCELAAEVKLLRRHLQWTVTYSSSGFASEQTGTAQSCHDLCPYTISEFSFM